MCPFSICKVPKNLFNSITSAIDKLDKHEWDYVSKEMVVKGTLEGIKGQYLILDQGVLNIRKFAGYEVSFNAG